jgi:hypothetical protein
MTGGLGLITGPSRKSDRITVTWVKGPTHREPNPLKNVPLSPEPRVFPPEPCFEAKSLEPIKEGQEFPPVDPLTGDSIASSDGNIAISRNENVVKAAETDNQTRAESEMARPSAADRLRQVQELHGADLISDSEYEAKRLEILGDL